MGLGAFFVERDEGPPHVIWIVGAQGMARSPWDALVRSLAEIILFPLHSLYRFASIELGAVAHFPDAPVDDDDGRLNVGWLVRMSPPHAGAVTQLTRAGVALGGVTFALRGRSGCLVGTAAVNGRSVTDVQLVDDDRVAIEGVEYIYKSVT
jgi:hypothetical protein